MEIQNFATIKDLQLFRPGTHNGGEYTEKDIEEMVNSSNACLPFILQSITEGGYAGNDIKLTKSVPGLLNFAHQKYLKDTLRELSKDVSIEFQKSGEWLTATLRNVKDELAEFIRDRFPFRSIELIPILKNPLDGKTYRNVIRSIGFLPPDIAPAVSGQDPMFALEFAEDGFITLYSQVDNNQRQQEDHSMDDNTYNAKASGQGSGENTLSIQEFEAYKREQAELIHEFKAQNEALKSENLGLKDKLEETKDRLDETISKTEAQEIQMFCEHLKTVRLKNKEGEFIVSQALIDTVKPLIEKADNKSILEFSDDKKVSQRTAIQEFTETVIEMARKGTILVPVTKQHEHTHVNPDNEASVNEFAGMTVDQIKFRAKEEYIKLGNDNTEAWRKAGNDPKYAWAFEPGAVNPFEGGK